jgi:hypothetical protein
MTRPLSQVALRLHPAPNKSLQRSGIDKVPGRGRGVGVLEQVMSAHVLKCQQPAAERGC